MGPMRYVQEDSASSSALTSRDLDLGCVGSYSMKSATVVTSNRNVGRTFPIAGMYSFHSSEEYCSDRPRSWRLERATLVKS